jgi:hypothetical protein
MFRAYCANYVGVCLYRSFLHEMSLCAEVAVPWPINLGDISTDSLGHTPAHRNISAYRNNSTYSNNGSVTAPLAHRLDDRGSIPIKTGPFSYPPRPDRLWGPPSLLYNDWHHYFLGAQQPEREASQSPHYSAEVNNACSFTSTASYVCMLSTQLRGTTPSSWHQHPRCLSVECTRSTLNRSSSIIMKVTSVVVTFAFIRVLLDLSNSHEASCKAQGHRAGEHPAPVGVRDAAETKHLSLA